MLRHSLRQITALPFEYSLFYFSNGKHFSSAAQKVCHYDALGVHPTATLEDIKKAYYDKARVYHPDTNQDPKSEEVFKSISKAYEILRDPVSRQVYDLNKLTGNLDTVTKQRNTTYEEYYTSNTASYYNNEWYGSEIRQHNGTVTGRYHEKSKFEGVLFKLSVALGVYFLYDLWQNEKKKRKKQKVIDSESQKVAVGPLVFESPLVFVRDRPIDPIKLQEEMKRKGFRIEYEDQKPRASNSHRKSRNKSHSETKVLDFNDFLEKRKDKE